MNVFDTNQLIVSQFDETHVADFFALNSHPEVMRYIRPVKNELECRSFLKENISLYKPGSVIGRYHVAEKATNSFVGTFSVLMMPDRDAYHIGYALMPWAQGRGWAKELVLGGLKWVFANTDKSELFAITEPENIRSVALLEKTGFVLQENIKGHKDDLSVFVINNQYFK